jgi:hypothetical protein
VSATRLDREPRRRAALTVQPVDAPASGTVDDVDRSCLWFADRDHASSVERTPTGPLVALTTEPQPVADAPCPEIPTGHQVIEATFTEQARLDATLSAALAYGQEHPDELIVCQAVARCERGSGDHRRHRRYVRGAVLRDRPWSVRRAGFGRCIAAGETATIVFGSTVASCDPALGYRLPPGEYTLQYWLTPMGDDRPVAGSVPVAIA